jgi:hypothetical protein
MLTQVLWLFGIVSALIINTELEITNIKPWVGLLNQLVT